MSIGGKAHFYRKKTRLFGKTTNTYATTISITENCHGDVVIPPSTTTFFGVCVLHSKLDTIPTLIVDVMHGRNTIIDADA